MKLRIALLLVPATLVLASCGEYAPPTPTRSVAEARQTERALLGVPTLEPAPTGAAGAAAPSPRPAPTEDPGVAALLTIPADDPRAMGSPDAPVTIIEYSDFE